MLSSEYLRLSLACSKAVKNNKFRLLLGLAAPPGTEQEHECS